MPAHVEGVRLVVLGPPDLLVTSLVAALRTRGVDAERLAPPDARCGSVAFAPGRPSVLLVDVDGANPGPTVREALGAGLVVLVIGSSANRERAVAAIAAGAVGWIRKTASLDVLADTVRAAASGRLQMSQQQREQWLAEHRSTNESVRAELDRLEQLSPREQQVLRHLADGLRAADVAGELFVSITTVRSHIRSILRKLGVNSQQQAIEAYRDISRRLGRILGSGPGT